MAARHLSVFDIGSIGYGASGLFVVFSRGSQSFVSVMGNCWFYKLLSDYQEYPSGAKVKKGHRWKLYRAGEWSEYLLLFIVVMFTVVSYMLMVR